MEVEAESTLFAKTVLYLFLPFAVLMYFRFRPAIATIIVLVGGTMFLPERILLEIPALPRLDKQSVTTAGALIGCLIKCPKALMRARPFRLADLVILFGIFSFLGTVATNQEMLWYPARDWIPRENWWNGLSVVFSDIMHLYFPFLIGRAIFRTSKDIKDLLTGYAIGALILSPLIPVEVRLSPQIHRWIYGFMPHDFLDSERGGGAFRAMLFMVGGGLALAMLTAQGIVSAAALSKVKKRIWILPRKLIAPYLFGVLLLMRSLAATIYAITFQLAVAYLKPRTQTLLAVLLACAAMAYTPLRLIGAFPTETLVAVAKDINEFRAISLKYRFDQEVYLIQKARQKLWLGWGEFERSHAFNRMGIETPPDGGWIVALGTRGIPGVILLFAPFAMAIFSARAGIKRVRDPSDRILLGALSLMTTMYMVDLLPNSLFSHLGILVAGALFGLSRSLAQQQVQPRVMVPMPTPTQGPAVVNPAMYRTDGTR